MGFQLLQLVFLCRVINPAIFDKFRDNPFQHVRNGIRNIQNEPRVIRLFLHFTIIFIVCVNVFGETEQPYLTGAGLPVEWLGVLYAAMSVIGLLVSRSIGWLTKRVSRVFILVSTGCMCCLALLAASVWVGNLWMAILVFVTLRLTRKVRYPVYSHLINEYIPSESRATTLSLLSLGDSFFDVVILLCFANIADWGIPVIAFGCALAVLVGVLIPIRPAANQEMAHRQVSS
jgi:MFS family permease